MVKTEQGRQNTFFQFKYMSFPWAMRYGELVAFFLKFDILFYAQGTCSFDICASIVAMGGGKSMKKHLTKSFCNTEKVHTIDGRKVEARGSFMRGGNLGMRYNKISCGRHISKCSLWHACH